MSSHLKREDDEPPNHELATREIAEETTRVPLYEQSADSIMIQRKLLADLQAIMGHQRQIESLMIDIISQEQEVAAGMEEAVASEKEVISLMEEIEASYSMLVSTGETAAYSEGRFARSKETFACSMEKHAAWKKDLSSWKKRLGLWTRTLGGFLYEASQMQAYIAKTMLRLGQVNELKEER